MSHMSIHHAAHATDSLRTCERVMSHMRMRHVAHMNESWRTCESVISRTRLRLLRIRMRRVTQMRLSQLPMRLVTLSQLQIRRVMISQLRMRRVTHLRDTTITNEACHALEWVPCRSNISLSGTTHCNTLQYTATHTHTYWHA